jgi:NADH dehydrogenase
MSVMLAETRADEATAVAEAPRRERKRVVIIGGGFAGIAAARALRRADVDVIFQPLLYQVATAVLSPAEIAAPIRQLEVKQKNLSVLLAEVTGIDVASRTIEASSPGAGALKIAYDYLVVATGMRPSYFGHDEFAQYAPGLKNLNDAETIRAKILGAFELAATTEDEAERARQMTFVLVGAGPSGVELAASLAQMVKGTLRGNFHRIDPAQANIILLDAGKRVLPTFAESLSRRATRRLTKLGVKVLTGVKVETRRAWSPAETGSPAPRCFGPRGLRHRRSQRCSAPRPTAQGARSLIPS